MKAASFGIRFVAIAAGIGLLSLGSAALIGSLNSARAQGLGPEVTGGTQPYVSFSGQTATGTTTIYTVPSNRILVVTGAALSTTASLYQDGTLKVNGSSYAMVSSSSTTPSLLAAGNGHVAFDPGSTVVINGSSSYFIQGYLAHQ